MLSERQFDHIILFLYLMIILISILWAVFFVMDNINACTQDPLKYTADYYAKELGVSNYTGLSFRLYDGIRTIKDVNIGADNFNASQLHILENQWKFP